MSEFTTKGSDPVGFLFLGLLAQADKHANRCLRHRHGDTTKLLVAKAVRFWIQASLSLFCPAPADFELVQCQVAAKASMAPHSSAKFRVELQSRRLKRDTSHRATHKRME